MFRIKKYRFFIIITITLLITIILIIGFDVRLKTTNYTIESSELPDSFDGYRICQISDFHGKSFGKDEEELIKHIKNGNPDIIIISGDFTDDSHSLNNASTLLEGIKDIAPIYAISGNHEFDSEELYQKTLELYKEYNVNVLEDADAKITRGNDSIWLHGKKYLFYDIQKYVPDIGADGYHILLYHDPAYFLYFQYLHYDLVIGGHTHGGLIRLPFIGGLIATTGKLFPKYDKGVFTSESGSKLVVSAGLGDAILPRFNNRPEVVIITLKKYK